MGLTPALPVFLFGTLRDLDLLAVVAGAPLPALPAVLPDHRVARADGQSFPVLVDASGGQAEGLLIAPTKDALARLDYYEAPYGYTRQITQVLQNGAPQEAEVYRPAPDSWAPAEDWSLTEWQSQYGPLMREAAVEIMQSMGIVTPDEIARRTPVIRSRAQQRLNAGAGQTPVRLRQPLTRDDVQTLERTRSYSHFFALDDVNLRFRTFEGGMSEPVDRAVFISADAVTVLPYDPVRDVVLLIEQFRAGIYLRGDPHPWSLEAVAGRQDPGETLEDTARREALEEAGLRLGALHKASSYYASPGAQTEYLTSYIGIAELPEAAAGIGGLAEEAEDIRSLVVSFERLMQAVEDGEAENGPLVISALWLAANRDRLRG